VHVADRREWKKIFRGNISSTVTSPGDHHHLHHRTSFIPPQSVRAYLAQLAQKNCLGRFAAPLPGAPRPRSKVLLSGHSRRNRPYLGLSSSSVQISCRLAQLCLVSAVIHRQRQKPCASARPFCSHLCSDCMQGSISSIINHWATGRSGGQTRAGLAA
jgi:hypothetical protein